MTGGTLRPQLLLARLRRPAQARAQDRDDPPRRQVAQVQARPVVWITVGYSHSPREKIFAAVIDEVEVKRFKDLSPRDIEHDNPEFRRLEETRATSSSRSTGARSPTTTS